MDGALSEAAEDKPRFFSLSQRIGRLRYFAYTLLAMVGCAVLLVSVYLLAWLLPPAIGKLVASLVFIAVKSFGIPLIIFILTIRRLHDINANGWWALTVLMPFVTLLFLFLRGTPGPNRFGPPPAANHAGLHFTAIAVPLLFIGTYVGLYASKPVGGPSTLQTPGTPSMQQSPTLKPYGS